MARERESWISAGLAVDSYDCEFEGCPREATDPTGRWCSDHDPENHRHDVLWRHYEHNPQRKENPVSSMHHGAVAAQLPRSDKLRAEAEWPFEVGLIYLTDLMVDHTYQRPPDEPFIKRGAADFDPTLVGTIDVNAREDGTFAILDGQQRAGMMQLVGKTACYCSIYRGLSLEDEAGFFFRKNKDRKTMLPYYSFRARAVAGDQEARNINAAVEALGFRLDAKTNDLDVIGAIRAVETAWRYTSPHRSESLTPALLTIRQSGVPQAGRKGAFDSTIITALGRFWQAYDDTQVERAVVADVLSEIGPTNIIGATRERMVVSKAGASWEGARVITEHVNKRLRGTGVRLDLKRLTPPTRTKKPEEEQ